MKIESNSIMIERLQEKDIEMVRQWRNSDEVRNYVNFRGYITSEMQKIWFDSVNNFNNFYFVIHYKGNKVGLGSIKKVDWENQSGEADIFFVEQKLIGSFLIVVWALSLGNMFFKIFGLKKLYAQIRKDNPRAQKFDKTLGYKLLSGEDDKESQMYVLTEDDFNKATKKFSVLMKPLGFSSKNLKITLEEIDFKTDFGERFIELLNNSPLLFDVTRQGNNIEYVQR